MIKAKEAALGIQKIGKSTSTSLMSLKPTETINLGLEAKADEQPLQSEVALEGMTKAEEAALGIQKIGKSTSASLLSKKSEMSLKPSETIITTSVFANEQSLQSKVPLEGKTNKVHDNDIVEIIKEEQVVRKNENAESSKKQNAKGLGVKKTVQLKKKKNVKFRCEICQVEVLARDFDTHKNGRKHGARLLIFTENKGSVPVSFAVSSETIPLTKDTVAANVLTKETNMKMADNFANPDKPSVPPVAEMLILIKNKETVLLESTPLTKDTSAVNVLTKETSMKMADNFANSDKPSVSPIAENVDKSTFISLVAEMLIFTKIEEIVPVSSTVSSETTPFTKDTHAVMF
ncbi:hypothetical protein L6164_011527 [Bauhinia variegata]|uniref:Uncharacterized protein n=1 Tax=Bauhinia variegata TaxID=167791 RepID=A0ACB9PA14_BAUVA|nr:hypothetical protein L6164_011527 [Bauhinia variegata]